jgi:hypothetical protein
MTGRAVLHDLHASIDVKGWVDELLLRVDNGTVAERAGLGLRVRQWRR